MTIDTTLSDLRSASLRGVCSGAVHLPGDPDYDAARLPWNVALDQRPAAVARATHGGGGAGGRPHRRGGRPEDRAPEHRPQRRPPGRPGTRRRRRPAHLGDDRRPRRPAAPRRPGRRRRPLVARHRARRRPRAGRPARQLPRRRHRRLLARRRHRVVRPQARPRHQQPARRRAGHRGRSARARRRHGEPRAVLGAARRGRQLRGGHGPGVPPLRHPDRVCGDARLGRHPGRARPAHAGSSGPPGRRTR